MKQLPLLPNRLKKQAPRLPAVTSKPYQAGCTDGDGFIPHRHFFWLEQLIGGVRPNGKLWIIHFACLTIDARERQRSALAMPDLCIRTATDRLYKWMTSQGLAFKCRGSVGEAG
jgi:hypothetical protein